MHCALALGLLLIGLLVGTLIESRKKNEHLSSVIRALPYSLQAPALHGGGVGITSYGGQFVLSCGDLPDPWISTHHKHAVISLHFRAKPWLLRSPPRQLAVSLVYRNLDPITGPDP